MRMDFYVYVLIDPRNGLPFYVGKGNGNRMINSMKDTFNPFKTRVINKIKSLGLEVIAKKVCGNLPESLAYKFENELVIKYGRRDNKTGILTNLNDGGYGGVNPSKEGRKKMSEINKGKILSKETKQKISDKLKGREVWNTGVPCREGTKRKISKANKGKIKSDKEKIKMSKRMLGSKNPMYGKHRTEEVKKILSEKLTGRKMPEGFGEN